MLAPEFPGVGAQFMGVCRGRLSEDCHAAFAACRAVRASDRPSYVRDTPAAWPFTRALWAHSQRVEDLEVQVLGLALRHLDPLDTDVRHLLFTKDLFNGRVEIER